MSHSKASCYFFVLNKPIKSFERSELNMFVEIDNLTCGGVLVWERPEIPSNALAFVSLTLSSGN